MRTTDPDLLSHAQNFRDEIAGLLHGTVCDEPPIGAVERGGRVVVAPYNEHLDKVPVPLSVAGQHRIDLRVEFRCTWDFTGQFLAIEWSEFALTLPGGEALLRVDYVRDHSWAPSHIHLHAESSALGYLLAYAGTTKPPKTQVLHLPVGGRRLRPSLEDVIAFAIHDLGVEAKPDYASSITSGRARWKRIQVEAAIRDVIKNDPEGAPNRLREAIDKGEQDIRAAMEAQQNEPPPRP